MKIAKKNRRQGVSKDEDDKVTPANNSNDTTTIKTASDEARKIKRTNS